MNKLEAQSLVEAELERTKDIYDPIDCIILAEKTIEKSWGWIFFYQSKAYVETGNFSEMLAGNAPIFVNRNTGQLTLSGTVHDINYYVKEYESELKYSD